MIRCDSFSYLLYCDKNTIYKFFQFCFFRLNFLLPPRGSFVIVKFSTSLNLSRNMNISVRSLYHMILENVCVDVCVCVCVCACVRACVYFWLFLMIELEFFSRVGSIRKSIKKPIFSKKNYFFNYRGSFVITKNVFFF